LFSDVAEILPLEHSSLRKKLTKIEGATVGVVNVEYNGIVLKEPVRLPVPNSIQCQFVPPGKKRK
jgi:hypothetical protein